MQINDLEWYLYFLFSYVSAYMVSVTFVLL